MSVIEIEHAARCPDCRVKPTGRRCYCGDVLCVNDRPHPACVARESRAVAAVVSVAPPERNPLRWPMKPWGLR